MGTPAPEQQAWGIWNQEVFVVGSLAQQFDPSDRLRELKYENALYKILAAIGVIASKHQLPTKKTLKVYLGVLLPWNEYSDRQRFESQLVQMLARFSFRDSSLKVKLTRFLLRPEGAGLAASRLRIQGQDWFSQRRLGILMFGHRNVTSLYFELGELKSGSSPLLGFSRFLEQVIELTSGLSSPPLVSAIFLAIHEAGSQLYRTDPAEMNYRLGKLTRNAYTVHPQWEKSGAIQALASARNPQLRTQEISALVKAIREATVDYWEQLAKWLKKSLPPTVDEVSISGGAAYFLQPELEDYFNAQPSLLPTPKGGLSEVRTGWYQPRHQYRPFSQICWGAGSIKQMLSALKLTDERCRQQGLTYRLLDVFGLFDCMIESENSREPKQTA